MICFPNAKINLGLNIKRKRPDGLHDIETIMVPVPLCDILEIVPTEGKDLTFRGTGIIVDGNPDENLCVKAYHLLKQTISLPPVSIHLHKCIPMGAGLGGGSSDAAYTLWMLNAMFHAGLTHSQLMQFASDLGADCPFFLVNQPCYATFTGTVLKPVTLDLSEYQVLIVKPGFSVNTAWAYSKVSDFSSHESPEYVVLQSITEWRKGLVNDFERIVFKEFPEMKFIKDQLYDLGAEYAALSGSGSAMYGIFKKPVTLTGKMFGDSFTWMGPLRNIPGRIHL